MNNRQKEFIELMKQGFNYGLLSECCNILDNKRERIRKADREAGIYPYYGPNGVQAYVNKYTFDGEFVLVAEKGVVTTDEGRPIVNWATGKIGCGDSVHIISEKQGTLLRFLYYYLQCVDIRMIVTTGMIPSLTITAFRNIRVPIIPIEYQQKIVNNLDMFYYSYKDFEKEVTLVNKLLKENFMSRIFNFKELK